MKGKHPCVGSARAAGLLELTPKSTALIAAAAALALGAPALAQTQTAQSVQIHSTGVEAVYAIEQSETWSYNWASQPAALAAFDAYFTLTTTGSPTAGQINSTKHDAFKAPNQCNFFCGLPLEPVTRTFGQGRSVTATPKAPGIYAPRTGWTMTAQTPGDPVDITLTDLFVASESVVRNLNPRRNAPWTRKYSFSLVDGQGASRLTSLAIELLYDDDPDDDISAEVIDSRWLGADFSQTVESGVSWYYAANGGSFGNAAAQALLLEGDVAAILLADDFPGNDGQGGQRALLPYQEYTVSDEGIYTLRIAGVVKGNAAIHDQAFEVEKVVLIIGGCLCP